MPTEEKPEKVKPPEHALSCYAVSRVTGEETTLKQLEDQVFQCRQQAVSGKISTEVIEKALCRVEAELADGRLEQQIEAMPEAQRGTLIVRYRKLFEAIEDARNAR